jgi:small subunit ribosomal protein S21e
VILFSSRWRAHDCPYAPFNLSLRRPNPLSSPCSSYTNKILAANDTAAVQINVADIDPATGLFTKTYKTFALCGYLRSQAEGDMALTNLITEAGATPSAE